MTDVDRGTESTDDDVGNGGSDGDVRAGASDGRESTLPAAPDVTAALAETLFANAQDALFVVDVDWGDGDGGRGEDPDDARFRLARVNPAYEAHTGLSNESLRGRTLQSVFGSEAGAAIVARYRDCVATLRPQRYEIRLSVPATGTVWDTQVAPVVVDGVVTRIVGATRDVTAAKRREAELERQNERLEAFASVVSHDLRNPLMVAHGSLALARRSGATADFDRAEAALRRMGTLVDDLLTLARQGRLVDDTRPVALGPLVDAVRESLPRAPDVDVAVGDYRVDADEPRLRQLVENLLSNAIRHGGDGPVRVRRLDHAEGFSVADDGPGIPPADRERVFEWGYTTVGGGTGLGLAIVESIADAHGWSVTVTDSAGGGARFEVVVAPEA